jgi:hypothetical protein
MAKKEPTEKWVLMTELNGEPLLHHFKLSNFGNVVRIKKGEGPEEVFNAKEIGGYKYISFTSKNGSRETIYVHRLVAEFFIQNKNENATYVIHADYDRKNNRFDNLKWVTQEVLYKHRAQKAGRTPGRTNSRKKLIRPEMTSNEAAAELKSSRKQMLAEFAGIRY